MSKRGKVWPPGSPNDKRRQGALAYYARKRCQHDFELVPFLSGGAGTYHARCKHCGLYMAKVKQYRRHGRRGKKVREDVGDSTG